MRAGRLVKTKGDWLMTNSAIRESAEFPALVAAAFFVRNAGVLIGLTILVLAALISG